MVTQKGTNFDDIVASALRENGVAERDINPEVNKQIPPQESLKGHSAEDGLNLDDEDGIKGQTKDEEFTKDSTEDGAKTSEKDSQSKAKSQKEDEPKGGALTKSEVETMLANASKEMQSTFDKTISRIQLQVQAALAPVSQFLTQQEQKELASLSPEERVNRRITTIESKLANNNTPQLNPNQTVDSQVTNFYDHLSTIVVENGFDPKDSRIDWASDTQDIVTGLRRFMKSLHTIELANRQEEVAKLQTQFNKALKKVRRQVGLDRVPLSGAGGKGVGELTGKESAHDLITIGIAQREAEEE